MDCENPIPSSPNSNCHNTLLGVAAPRLIVDFTLPFDSFAPSSVETVFKISTSEGTGFDSPEIRKISNKFLGSICIFIPEHSPSHNVQKAAFLSQEAYDRAKASQTGFQKEIFILEPEKWREISSRANGWVDVAAFNHLSFNFEYKWHYDYRPRKVNTSSRGIKFDPALSEPDCLKVGIKAVNIEAIAYPTLIPCLLNFKENIFGYWDDYTSFTADTSPLDDNNLNDLDDGWKTPFRPFSVIVDVEVSDIVARLPFAPNYKLPTGGPLVKLNTIWFELDKHYQETRMQLIISDLDLTFDHIHSGVKVRISDLDSGMHRGNSMIPAFRVRPALSGRKRNAEIMESLLSMHYFFSFRDCNIVDLHSFLLKDAKILIYHWNMHGCKKLKLENFPVMPLLIFLSIYSFGLIKWLLFWMISLRNTNSQENLLSEMK